jgi:hypothetical protein
MARSSGGKWWCSRLVGVERKGNELMAGACESVVGDIRGGLAKCASPRRKRNPVNT